jgi:two-component system, chemotaxis family, CheB/CheR fusion protein
MAGSGPQAPVSVLHVEDDTALSASVALLLRTAGYISGAVASGDEALAWIDHRRHDPDVLIVDFELPGELHGGDVAQEIFRALGRPIPTIMLSGQLTEITPPWMPGAPLLCVWKPVDPDVLLKAVEVFAIFGGFVRERSGRPGERSALRR